MKHFIILTIAVLAGCSAAPEKAETPQLPSEDEKALLGLDEEYRQHIEATALPTILYDAGDLGKELAGKAKEVKVIESKYSKFANSQDPIALAHTYLRYGQLYLNLACELSTIEPATLQGNAEALRIYEQELAKSTAPLFDKAKQSFDRVAAMENKYGDAAKQISDSWANDVATRCQSTSAHWAASTRPEPKAPEPKKKSEKKVAVLGALSGSSGGLSGSLLGTGGLGLRGAGLGGGCYEGATSPKCVAQFEENCSKGKQLDCRSLAIAHYKNADDKRAFEAMDKYCEGKISDCGLAYGFTTPQRLPDFKAGCKNDDLLSCLQLARTMDEQQSAHGFGSCTTKSALPDYSKSSKKKCLAGDSKQCWALAGHLATKQQVESGKSSSILGSLSGGLGLAGTAAKQDRATRIEKERQRCKNGEYFACSQYEKFMKEDGKDLYAAFKPLCTPASAEACDRTIQHAKKGQDISQPLKLVIESCAVGHASDCYVAAKLFHAGKKVQQSKSCAAALAFEMCHPDKSFECQDINRIFHPKKKKTKK